MKRSAPEGASRTLIAASRADLLATWRWKNERSMRQLTRVAQGGVHGLGRATISPASPRRHDFDQEATGARSRLSRAAARLERVLAARDQLLVVMNLDMNQGLYCPARNSRADRGLRTAPGRKFVASTLLIRGWPSFVHRGERGDMHSASIRHTKRGEDNELGRSRVLRSASWLRSHCVRLRALSAGSRERPGGWSDPAFLHLRRPRSAPSVPLHTV